MHISGAIFEMAAKNGMFFIDCKNKSDDPNTQYYSFGNERGDFYIMRICTLEDGLECRYAVYGKQANYEEIWNNRENISYDYIWKAKK